MSCRACPFAYTDESEKIQNYGCLPSAYDILQYEKYKIGNWGCHDNETKICAGLRRYLKVIDESLPTISYTEWNETGVAHKQLLELIEKEKQSKLPISNEDK